MDRPTKRRIVEYYHFVLTILFTVIKKLMDAITETMRKKAWFYHFTEELYKNGSISEERKIELKKQISMLKVQDKGNGKMQLPRAAS